jgi:hypothetical protein
LITDVHESRNTNTSISITVLCACIGLLVIGVPAQGVTRRATTEVAQYGASSTQLSLAASVVSSFQVLKIEDRWLPDTIASVADRLTIILERKIEAHPALNQVLTVTCLPRADLSDSSAKTLAAI